MTFLKEIDFRETAIGKIPKDWGIKKLEDVTDSCENGIWGDDPSSKVDSYPVIRSTEITYDGKIDLSTVAQRKIPTEKIGRYTLQNGDILIVGSSGSARLIGRAALFTNPDNRKYLFSNFMIRMRPNSVNPWFLHYFLNSKKYFRFLRSLQQTSTGLRNLPKKEFLQFNVLLPSPQEQKGIVGVLSVVDSAIEMTKEVIAKTKHLKTIILQQLMTRGIGHRKFKKTEFGEIPEDWAIERFSNYCESSAYGPRFGAELYSAEGRIGTIRTTDFTDEGMINFNTVPMANLSEDEMREHILKVGDLLISRSGTVGLSVVFPNHTGVYIPGAYLIRFRMKEKVFPQWLKYYFDSGIGANSLRRLSEGGVQRNLKGSSVLRLRIPIPSISEQKQIATIISIFDRKLGLEKKKKETIEKIKSGLMDLLLTGKVRAKVD